MAQQHARSACATRCAPFRADGTLPDYPLGSDFTEVEQRLVKALGWLKANTATTGRQAAHDRRRVGIEQSCG